MDKVYLLYGVKCGAEELLGVYATADLAGIVGATFTANGTYESVNVECWLVGTE